MLEPEPGACRAAVRLFAAPVTQADAMALPLPDASAGLLWSLGVLCTEATQRKQLAMPREMRGVARPGGRIGLLVYLATTSRLDDPPQGNHFPADGQLGALFPQAVERELQRRFGSTPQLSAATEQRPDRSPAQRRPAHLPGDPPARD